MARSETWFNQRERRYQPTRDQALVILRALAAKLPQVTYSERSTRTLVVTTYLDSKERDYLRMVEDSLGRISLKLRIREYLPLYDGEQPDEPAAIPTDCYLERKERAGEVRQKQRILVPKRDVGAVVRREKRVFGDSDVVSVLEAELAQRPLEPVLVSAYERRVFGSDRDGLRVTFDERLRFFPPPEGLYDRHPALTPAVLGGATAPGPGRILEIKEPGGAATPPWLESLIAGVAEIDSYSKFRDGMRALAEEEHQHNRPLTRPMISIK